MKEARERIGIDQAEAARRLGVKVHVLSNIEKCRAPLRCDLALRVCRELLFNEEWLATGGVESLNLALRKVAGRTVDLSRWEPLFFRTPLDLLSETILTAIPYRALYSDAYSIVLAPAVEKLSERNWLLPIVHTTPSDRREFRAELLSLLVERFGTILRFKAEEIGFPHDAQRLVEWDFVDDVTKATFLIAHRSYGLETPFQHDASFDFLRTLVADTVTPIGTLGASANVTVKEGRVQSVTPVVGKQSRETRKK